MTEDPLAQLKDIHLPAHLETGWPALGIWLLAVTALVLGLVFVYAYLQYQKKRQIQKRLINELKNINLDNAKALNLSNEILKKAALHYYSRNQVAHLHGLDWLNFLDAQLKDIDKGFIEQQEAWLSLYRRSPQKASLHHLQQAHTWLVHALPPKKSTDSKTGGNNV